MGKWILHHFQFTVGQFRGVCGGIGWSVGKCFGINKTDFSRWLWNDADEVLVKLFRVSAIQPLAWNIWMTSSTSGSGEGTRSGLIDIIPINSIKTTKPQLIATLYGQIEQRSIRRSGWWWIWRRYDYNEYEPDRRKVCPNGWVVQLECVDWWTNVLTLWPDSGLMCSSSDKSGDPKVILQVIRIDDKNLWKTLKSKRVTEFVL